MPASRADKCQRCSQVRGLPYSGNELKYFKGSFKTDSKALVYSNLQMNHSRDAIFLKKIKELYSSLIINHSESTFSSSQPIGPKHLSVGFCSQGIWTLSTETELLKKSSSPDIFQGAMVPLDMLWEPPGKKGICWSGLRASVLTIISKSVIGWVISHV